jgi:hypothetical protein
VDCDSHSQLKPLNLDSTERLPKVLEGRPPHTQVLRSDSGEALELQVPFSVFVQ